MVLEKIFPPHETFIERAILPDEIYDAQRYGGAIEGVSVESEEEGGGRPVEEKKGFRNWANRIL